MVQQDVELEPDQLGAPLEAANAMDELNAAMQQTDGGNWEDSVAQMNLKQQEIFHKVCRHLQFSSDQLFMFISGAEALERAS